MTSSLNPITCGIPQGSVLSRLLFLSGINKIKFVTTNKPRFFAENTCLVLQNPSYNHQKAKISLEIHKVNNWMQVNWLTQWFSNYIQSRRT